MKYQPQADIPEGINVSDSHPLKEFSFLISAVLAVVIIFSMLIVYTVDWLAEQIPFSYEESMVSAFSLKFADRNEVDDYLQSIADKLRSAMQLPDDTKIHVHYIDDKTVNGMSSLAGNIFIYRGLLEKLDSENAIAMLIGHEMAHVKYRHPLKGLGKAIILSVFYSMILGQSSDISSQLMTEAGSLTLLKFSREQERLSDELGLRAVAQVYHHINGASDLFTSLQQSGTVSPPEFLSSHPDTQKRIDHLVELAQKNGWSQQGAVLPVPENIRKSIVQKSL